MKGLLIALLTTMVLGVAGVAIIAYTVLSPRTSGPVLSPQVTTQAPDAQLQEVTVVSDGSVTAKPDVAYVSAGVESRASNAAEAMDANATTMARVIDALKALGARDEDLQTQGLNLYPITGPQGPNDVTPPDEVRAYVAHNGLTVTVNDLSRAGAMLDAAIQVGANTSNGIRFGIKDDTPFRDQAVRLAASNARSRAEAMAQAVGVHILKLNRMSEEVTAGPMSEAKAGLGGAATPIQPGQLVISARVTATFAYEQ